MRDRPVYAIDSVDHALHLVTLLQTEGALRVTDVAARLQVSVSTAHRLLAMLVFRDFAEQQQDRQYIAGPALSGAREVGVLPVAALRAVALPHLGGLTDETNESSNLIVLTGTEARFVATKESRQVLRVGDRSGRTLPAHLTSGGKAILASFDKSRIRELYAQHPDVDLTRVVRELTVTRRRGFAINHQQTERGLTAVGVAVRDHDGAAIAAVSLALPSARFDRAQLPRYVRALQSTSRRIEEDLPSK